MSGVGVVESLPAGAGVVHFLDGSFVVPGPRFSPTPSQMARLEMAVSAGPARSAQLAAIGPHLLAEIEAELSREARRRAKMEASDRIIVPAKVSGAIRTGGPALFVDDGRSERVLVLSPEERHPESGEPEREVSFLDKAGEVFMVKAANLCPCDDLFRALPLAPEALETGKWAGVPQNAEAYQAALKSKAPAFDKFDRVAPVKPEDVRLDLARMTPHQRERLRIAELKLARAEQRKTFRQKVIAGHVVGYGRMTNEEKTERADYRAEMDRLQQETLAANDRAEVSRGRVETLALEQMRGGAMAVHADGHLTRKNGLDTLRMSGALTVIEHAAGEKYAAIFDEAKTALKIANWSGAGGGSPDPEAERRQRLKLVAAQQRVTFLHALVQARVKSPRAVMVLRRVAGEGTPVSHFSKGAGRALNVEALKAALGALADMWGLQ